MQNYEYEDRIMLTQKSYLDILNDYQSFYPEVNAIEQTNYYFDDQNLSIIKSHKVLRIRKISNSKYELTLKVKREDGDLEINQNITEKEAEQMIQNNKFPNGEVKEHVDLSVHLITALTTIRYEFKENGSLIVIDKNLYSGLIDYDLEVESNSKEKAHEVLMNISNKYKLIYDEKYKSKSRRAIEKIRN